VLLCVVFVFFVFVCLSFGFSLLQARRIRVYSHEIISSDRQYANERWSGASVKTAKENWCVRLAHFTSEDRAYGALRLLKTSVNDHFAV